MKNGWKKPPVASQTWIYQASEQALACIGPHVLTTPMVASPSLSLFTSSEVHLKLESEQVTGSFKARGAVNAVLALSSEELCQGPMVTSSTGNHALAFIHACKERFKGSSLGTWVPPLIVLPAAITEYKMARLRNEVEGFPIELMVLKQSSDVNDSEAEASRLAKERHGHYISPYNNKAIIGGQGTIALELTCQLMRSQADVVFVAVGGGGLISGISGVLKCIDPTVIVVGCQPANSDIMKQSVLAGKVVQGISLPTLSDATAGGIDDDSVTLDPCMRHVDEWVTVEEEEIAAAMQLVLENDKLVIEGAAGCAVAAFIKSSDRFLGKSTVIIVCGKNKGDYSVWEE
jgi:threonine dehydratase